MPVCARVYIYIYFAIRLVSLPSTRNTFYRSNASTRSPRGGEDPKVASPAVSWFFSRFLALQVISEKKKSDRLNIIELDER